MRKRARESAKRFTEAEFVKGWLLQMDALVELQIQRSGNGSTQKK
jgi:alpha-1,2-mannosyltransferase